MMTEFGRLTREGGYVRIGQLSQSEMLACPFCIIDFDHYRPDGTCRCDDPTEQERMIREWGYSRTDFTKEPEPA